MVFYLPRKWDINLFRPWRDIEEHGTFEMHLDAQFQCDHLLMEKHLFNKEGMSALDEVREVVRTIFYGHHRNSFYLFAINHFLHPDLPVMHLRIQPPVRFSPPGSPLLLVSVLDHQLARKLIADGKLDRETHEEDFHRLITERVSREVCTIRLSSAEELNLFRYALRVNSTLMRRSVWQSKNLPRYEDNPWMPTFISPLYSHNTIGFCDEFSTEVSEPLSRGTFVRFNVDYGSFDFSPLIMCAACFVKKIKLKKCKQCKKVSYCSSACQKKHWAIHKSSCCI